MPTGIYLIPVEQVTVNGGIYRGPEYFKWRFDTSATGTSIDCRWSMMDYGFVNAALLVAFNITSADNTSLVAHADVYRFPDTLDQPITDGSVLTTKFEAINIPTDWTTASTTYRQFLRYTAGMFQFNQRYGGIAANTDGGRHSIFDNGRTLNSQWNSLSTQEKTWFNDTTHSFGFPQNVTGNPRLRTLAKQAGDLWGANSFIMGGLEF